MQFEPQKNPVYCSRTAGLKLGRLHESLFNFGIAGPDNSRFKNFLDTMKEIPNLEVIASSGIHAFYSIRLPKSLLGKENEVQELVNAIYNNLIVPNQTDKERLHIASGIINSIIHLTGYKLSIPNKLIEQPTPSATFHV